ncbi:hypothetical protein RvY_13360-2 [Ramazzottius varieornatus]|uniref:Uncharacterized protein n=1 Tax=Ramazzottius varieornatus TaxID=947166 RepID=A0A1D1VMM3_RAMVA|nr:hypothetical protein RvY_13360-2 [Ramazzottius varieornatus]
MGEDNEVLPGWRTAAEEHGCRSRLRKPTSFVYAVDGYRPLGARYHCARFRKLRCRILRTVFFPSLFHHSSVSANGGRATNGFNEVAISSGAHSHCCQLKVRAPWDSDLVQLICPRPR